MRLKSIAGSILLLVCPLAVAASQESGAQKPHINWEVKSRFRLFTSERDFDRHVAAHRGDGVLAAEQRLARDSGGQGWARDVIDHLCLEPAGRLLDSCMRDGRQENYLAPAEHRIGAVVADAGADTACTWIFDDADSAPRQITLPCAEEVGAWVRFGRPTTVSVHVIHADETTEDVRTEIVVRDFLIVGMGDSVASGDGNPDRPLALADDGFCFRRLLGGGGDYFRPGRAGFRGDKACDTGTAKWDGDWNRYGAGWISPACHRSLYSYQTRAALALAVENAHAAVTYVPLACTGATIPHGLLGPQRAREIVCTGTGLSCLATVPSQVAQLRKIVAEAHRGVDAVLLTVGGNDALFSGLIGQVMIRPSPERRLFTRAGMIASIADAQNAIDTVLPSAFATLRAALKPLVGDELWRVIFVSYGHPGLLGGAPCPGGRYGFDIHPAFGIDAGRMKQVAEFVERSLFPRLKDLASCEGAAPCTNATDRMTFVDGHQHAFADHGFCARSEDDPVFDRECFSAAGDSFLESLVEAATDPLTCGRQAPEFEPYASRARWIRTANDSYFIAMTYPEGVPSTLQPTDIHDATWGVLSALYGGALHPTAEGHAAMADAALPALREVLGLPAPTQ
jgi:hypothetical protein